jgi:hypothetical protein
MISFVEFNNDPSAQRREEDREVSAIARISPAHSGSPSDGAGNVIHPVGVYLAARSR